MKYYTPFDKKEIIIGLDSGKDNYILATESSCDETAAAVVKNGREVLSNVVATQIKTHQKFGGVVPEVAAREHMDSINFVIAEALEKANLDFEDIDAFATTVGPGLVGSLLVGANAAKALSFTHNKPFIGVNHLNAHVCANYIDTDLKPPFLCLLISGGHTQLIKVESYEKQEIIGETLDDAIGEAYDKTARLIGLAYPGGPNLDKLAKKGDNKKYQLPKPNVAGYDFSFSGLKTAVLRLTKELDANGGFKKEDLSAVFQETASEIVLRKTFKALVEFDIKTVALAGGVAANSEIRRKFFDLEKKGYKVYAPAMKYCTDNASMIASAAYFLSNNYTSLDTEVFSRIR